MAAVKWTRFLSLATHRLPKNQKNRQYFKLLVDCVNISMASLQNSDGVLTIHQYEPVLRTTDYSAENSEKRILTFKPNIGQYWVIFGSYRYYTIDILTECGSRFTATTSLNEYIDVNIAHTRWVEKVDFHIKSSLVSTSILLSVEWSLEI